MMHCMQITALTVFWLLFFSSRPLLQFVYIMLVMALE